MTISSTETRVEYITSGQTSFSVPFEFFEGQDLRVRVYPNPLDDEDFRDLIFGSEFLVTGGDGKPGAIQIIGAPIPSAQLLVIQSNLSFGQIVAYQKHGPFPAKAHERALDRLALQIKQVAANAGVAGGDPKLGVFSFNGRDGHVLPLARDYQGFYSALGHVHSWGEIQNKPSVFPPANHQHRWGEILDKPATYPPSVHQHGWSEITGKPVTYPPGGNEIGAVQYRASSSETAGSDYMRITEGPLAPGITIGTVQTYVFDGSVAPGSYKLVAQVGYDLEENAYGPTMTGVSYAIEAPSIHLHAPDLIEGERLVLGPGGVLVSEPSAIAPVIDRSIYNAADIDIPDGVWVTVPVDLTITRDTFSNSGQWVLSVPFSVDSNQDFDLTFEIVINGTPTGRTFQRQHTDNIGFFWVVISSEVQNVYPPGASVDFRVQRTGAPSANVTIPAATSNVIAELLHFGQNPTVTYLQDLLDVSVPAPNDGDVLTWNEGNQQWEALEGGGGGTAGVVSFNSRQGNVVSEAADYAAFYKNISYVPAWTEITGKPTQFPPLQHTHVIGDVTNLQAELDGKSDVGHAHDWTEISGKPTEFRPEIHQHSISDVFFLQEALDGKSPTDHVHQWSQIQAKPSVFPPESHNISFHSDVNTSSAQTGQVLTYIAGLWVPRDPLAGGVDWDDITGKPATFPPSPHFHQISEVSGLTAALNNKAELDHVHQWSEIQNKPTTFPPSGHNLTSHTDVDTTGATTNMVLTYVGGVWVPRAGGGGGTPEWDDILNKPSEFPPSSHTHPWGQITSKPTSFPPDIHGLGFHSDVDTSIANPNDILVYDGAQWLPRSIPPDVGAHPLGAHTDTDLLDPNDGEVVTWSSAQQKWINLLPPGGGPGGGVDSVFGRTGNVIAEAGDYASFYKNISYVPGWSEITGKPTEFPPEDHTHPWDEVTNKPSSFPPASHTLTSHSDVDVVNAQEGQILAFIGGVWVPQNNVGGVSSVFSRTGDVVAEAADYASFYKDITYVPGWAEITGKPSEFPPEAHTHAIDDVTGLQAALDGKAATVHTHILEDVTGLTDILDSKSNVGHSHAWDEITNKPTEFNPSPHTHVWGDIFEKPTEFPPEDHTHAISEVNGLQAALDSKVGAAYVQGEVHKPVRWLDDVPYTLVLDDLGRTVQMDNRSAGHALTVPPNSEVPFPVGTRINVANWGNGTQTVPITPGAGVIIHSKGDKLNVADRFGGATLEKIQADAWWLIGDLS